MNQTKSYVTYVSELEHLVFIGVQKFKNTKTEQKLTCWKEKA